MLYYNIAILNVLVILFNITLSVYFINTQPHNCDKFIIYVAFILSAAAIICDIIYMLLA